MNKPEDEGSVYLQSKLLNAKNVLQTELGEEVEEIKLPNAYATEEFESEEVKKEGDNPEETNGEAKEEPEQKRADGDSGPKGDDVKK